jgi:hypothetical protein
VSDAEVTLEILLHDGFTMGLLLLGAVMAALGAVLVSRKRGRPYAASFIALFGLVLILALTLAPTTSFGGVLGVTSVGAYGEQVNVCLRSTWSDIPATLPTADGALNVLLYLPTAVGLGWLLRRKTVAIFGLVALSAIIEMVQAGIGRSCQASDWLANSTGAVMGVAVVIVVSSIARRVHTTGRIQQFAP